MTLECVVANLSGKVRLRSLKGRDYLIAPITLIVQGVLNGSHGPLFYSAEELSKEPEKWDRVPIVVYHPTENGEPISAQNNQDVHIGLIRKPKFKIDRLVAEGWFDVERTRLVDNRVLVSLQRGKQIELSTGLVTDQVAQTGEYGGVAYRALATNYRPDHLAILPDMVGACSIRDGCGVLVNEGQQLFFNNLAKETTMAKLSDAQRKEVIDSLIANCDCWDEIDREVLNKVSDEKLEKLQKHVADVVQNRAVADAARKGFEAGDVGYTFNEETKTFTGTKKAKPKSAEKKEEEKPVVNEEKKQPQTTEEWIAAAPPEIQSVVLNAISMEAAQKQELIKTITANKKNLFKPEYLMTKPVQELQAIAALARTEESKVVSNFFGSSVPAAGLGDAADKEDILPLPTVNWSEKAS